MTTVADNLENVRHNIEKMCSQFRRIESTVHLLAVSKTVEVERINEAIAAGQVHFGENYLQEALPKIKRIRRPDITWHYIGAIQSNKTAEIAAAFDWVHTVASIKVATRLNRQRSDERSPLKVMVQVNISDEASKAGVSVSGASDLIERMMDLDRLEIRGLMAIPEPRTGLEAQRESFRALRVLRDDIANRYPNRLPHFSDLSMGMSGDMEAAIAEGATWLRIGTAIFGPRTTTD